MRSTNYVEETQPEVGTKGHERAHKPPLMIRGVQQCLRCRTEGLRVNTRR